MYVLGINDGHLATAALIKDGKIIACVSEERFTGIKNQAGIPVNSIKYCLDFAKIKPLDIDLIVFGGKLLPPTTHNVKIEHGIYSQIYSILKPILTFARLLSIRLPVIRKLEEVIYNPIASFFTPLVQRQRIRRLIEHFNFGDTKIEFLDHHMAHAYSAVFASGWVKERQPLLILTCDGEGDGLSASVNIYQNGKLNTISKTSMTNSLGNLYRAVTGYLGMKPLEHEYKVMGLAAYVENDNKANELYNKIKDLVTVDGKTLRLKTKVNSQLFKLGYLDSFLKNYRFDHVAYATQRLTEDVLQTWVKAVIKRVKGRKILLSGGVFMNVKANQKILELPEVQNLFIMPSCGDESNALGAAYWGYNRLSNNIPDPIENLYLGPEYGNKQIENALKVHGAYKKLAISRPKNLEKTIAELLAKGHVVARFSGRMEWGARALGNRSILADASRPEVAETINRMIKSRDFWMPFAPVVMERHAHKYIINPKKMHAPFMIITFDTTSTGKQVLKAAIHGYDKTVRPQIIDQQINPSYYKILEEFAKITGKYGFLNTSFNLHGYPIVASPNDALYVFENSGLQFLVLSDKLIEKENSVRMHK